MKKDVKVAVIYKYEDGNPVSVHSAFISRDKAELTLSLISNCYHGIGEFGIEVVDLPFVGRHIYYCKGYYGYDYTTTGMVRVGSIDLPKVFSCKSDVKDYSKIWSTAVSKALWLDTDKVIITEDSICTLDSFGDPFIDGDCFEGNFRVEIEKIKVNKNSLNELELGLMSKAS